MRASADHGRANKPEPTGWLGLLFILPSTLFILLLFILPLIMTVWMSFYNWPLLGRTKFIGLANYIELAGDTQLWHSLGFTMLYTFLVTTALFLVAFPLALLVDRPMRIAGFFRTIYFLPVVIGFGAASTLWMWLLNPDNGVFAELLQAVGLVNSAPRPLESFWTALAVIILMVVWKTAGFTMVILLTGLQGIPDDIIEAAKIDGASPFSRFRRITLPLMRNSIMLALILNITSSMLAFDQFFIITQGGPQNSTISAVYSIYLASFSSYRLGYGSAISFSLLVVLVAISSIQFVFLRQRPEGER
ncbi:sugar ABC transporter permease [Rhizobium sp. VS19-DR104.2]|uniref:carbohydrate ABC transporter permease n=1 Tax=unclassified Rhizobium TaxID=2613769 RepID=UPI001AD97DDD|nr:MULTISPECIES: sugar ABC transporter permease [unclassified Rhizobium]MBO9101276.1 sugar ABC transporter permease [Rhizobium sp. L58/93]MBO9134534.1 sugar ABC transporter permease [Rhizobium sp. B209b/85]MBO9171835.1 sugar ABC transporter permease [Rhizobium sp. L245/93]MBO9182716.1 sugar ABC transporter permease [Rhizobium sp. E27B/91]MBZ5762043.1 sugar ABC transporter permease [Rhizobium sp. VS19-DR96]